MPDVANASIQPQLRATSRMTSLANILLDFAHVINAQLRPLRKAIAPLWVRLRGRVRLSGSGKIVLGEGISPTGRVVPIELVTYEDASKNIHSSYGSSIAARASVTIGSYCHLGHHMFVLENNQHDANPVVRGQSLDRLEGDNSSPAFALPAVR
jgi:hypothetical protein